MDGENKVFSRKKKKKSPRAIGNDEFRFNDASTHEGHLRHNGVLSWFSNETAVMISNICKKNVKLEQI